MEDLYRIWLCSECRVPARIVGELYEYFLSYEEIYNTSFDDINDFNLNLTPTVIKKLANKNIQESERILKDCIAGDIKIVTYADDKYPSLLKEIQNPPSVIYYKGSLISDDELCISIVGSRKPSLYGEKMAKAISDGLTKTGIVIVSGMARGIDSEAHRGCIAAGGKTVAVLGCGPDIVYPPENKNLMNTILEKGCVMSEFPPGTPALAKHFPSRNRIVSGLSRGVVIVEGKASSGSTITAELALSQGREVFGVPGNVDNPLSHAAHKIIREGGRLVTSAEDIIVDLSADYPELMKETVFSEKTKTNKEEIKVKNMTAEQEKIYNLLKDSDPVHIDEICERANLEISLVNQSLLMLEIQGFARQLPNKYFVRLK